MIVIIHPKSEKFNKTLIESIVFDSLITFLELTDSLILSKNQQK